MNAFPDPESDETATLHELALRLINERRLYSHSEPKQLLVRQLSSQWPADAPFPDDSRILGSLEESPGRILIALDTHLSPQAVLDFYRDRLQSAGWVEATLFKRQANIYDWVRFCQRDRGLALDIRPQQPKSRPTQVSLELEKNLCLAPCAQIDQQIELKRTEMLFSTLAGLPDAQPGSVQINDRSLSKIVRTINLDLLAVDQRYKTELQRTGWVAGEAGQWRSFSWSTWTLQDDRGATWHGVLTLILDSRPGPRYIILQFLIEEEPWPLAAPINVVAQSQTDQVAALRELALRLLGYSNSPEPASLVVGQAPKAWPPEIQLPENSRLLGSLEYPQKFISLIFDTVLTPQAVLDFCRERLQPAGWIERLPETRDMFDSGLRGIQFCQGPQGPALELCLRQLKPGPTQVRLNLRMDPAHSPCAKSRRKALPRKALKAPIPALPPPLGARYLSATGGGSAENNWYTEIILETALDLTPIAGYYAAQFQQAGWLPGAIDNSDDFALSQWMFQDDSGKQWLGLFTITFDRRLTSSRFILQLWVGLQQRKEDSPLAAYPVRF